MSVSLMVIFLGLLVEKILIRYVYIMQGAAWAAPFFLREYGVLVATVLYPREIKIKDNAGKECWLSPSYTRGKLKQKTARVVECGNQKLLLAGEKKASCRG